MGIQIKDDSSHHTSTPKVHGSNGSRESYFVITQIKRASKLFHMRALQVKNSRVNCTKYFGETHQRNIVPLMKTFYCSLMAL